MSPESDLDVHIPAWEKSDKNDFLIQVCDKSNNCRRKRPSDNGYVFIFLNNQMEVT